MSSDGHSDLAHEYPAGVYADTPSPTEPISVVDFTTMQPLDTTAPIFSPQPVTASSSSSDITAMF
jgi:hypothetical protein